MFRETMRPKTLDDAPRPDKDSPPQASFDDLLRALDTTGYKDGPISYKLTHDGNLEALAILSDEEKTQLREVIRGKLKLLLLEGRTNEAARIIHDFSETFTESEAIELTTLSNSQKNGAPLGVMDQARAFDLQAKSPLLENLRIDQQEIRGVMSEVLRNLYNSDHLSRIAGMLQYPETLKALDETIDDFIAYTESKLKTTDSPQAILEMRHEFLTAVFDAVSKFAETTKSLPKQGGKSETTIEGLMKKIDGELLKMENLSTHLDFYNIHE